MVPRGRLITFEGGEGTGKSTQVRLFADALAAAGYRVRLVREPGGTAIGEAIRDILLDAANRELDSRAELLLYEAARAQLVHEVLAPALAAGELVVCDRFFDSTTAYQGHGRDLPVDLIDDLNLFATAGLEPDLTILLDIDPVRGIERATRVATDRLEAEDLAFHQRVRDGFLAVARRHPGRFAVIDASGTVDDVAAAVWSVFQQRIIGTSTDTA